jgi:hypothetical protein
MPPFRHPFGLDRRNAIEGPLPIAGPPANYNEFCPLEDLSCGKAGSALGARLFDRPGGPSPEDSRAYRPVVGPWSRLSSAVGQGPL